MRIPNIYPIFLLLAVLLSCSERTGAEYISELRLSGVSCIETRGIVTGSELTDPEAERTIHLSAYNLDRHKDLTRGSTFRPSADGSYWQAYKGTEPSPVYWHPDEEFSFLAYSTGTTSPDAVWDQDNATSQVRLQISSLQDDILYAGTDNQPGISDPVALAFHHTQAWVEFRIRSGLSAATTIDDVTFKNVFGSGALTITNGTGSPSISWDFSATSLSDCKVFPSGTPATVTDPSQTVTVNALLPPQNATQFVIDITSGGVKKTVSPEPTAGRWETGSHYIYTIYISEAVTRSSSSRASDIHAEVTLTQEQW